VEKLYASITGCSGIISVSVSDSHSGTNATAIVECVSTSLDVDSSISINLGYVDNHQTIFTGYVKQIQKPSNPDIYTISAADILIRASEYFIVSDNPNYPLKYQNIAAETLVGNLMSMAGISSYSGETSNYIWGVNGPITISLTSALDYSTFLAGLIAWTVYADGSGTVHFASRPPYPVGGDSSVATLDYTNSTAFTSYKTDKDLRNKIVVWGAYGIYATASSANSWDPVTSSSRAILPSGFYKAAVVSSTIIDSQTMADSACSYNLSLYNRLTAGVTLTGTGNPAITCHKVINVDAPDLGISNLLYYCYSVEHQWSSSGYTTNIEGHR
jgi:hypothetical protein